MVYRRSHLQIPTVLREPVLHNRRLNNVGFSTALSFHGAYPTRVCFVARHLPINLPALPGAWSSL